MFRDTLFQQFSNPRLSCRIFFFSYLEVNHNHIGKSLFTFLPQSSTGLSLSDEDNKMKFLNNESA